MLSRPCWRDQCCQHGFELETLRFQLKPLQTSAPVAYVQDPRHGRETSASSSTALVVIGRDVDKAVVRSVSSQQNRQTPGTRHAVSGNEFWCPVTNKSLWNAIDSAQDSLLQYVGHGCNDCFPHGKAQCGSQAARRGVPSAQRRKGFEQASHTAKHAAASACIFQRQPYGMQL